MMFNRRQVLFGVAGEGAISGFRCNAAVSTVAKRLGMLIVGDRDDAEEIAYQRALFGSLANRGWAEGKNLSVVRAYAGQEPSVERLTELAHELLRSRVDLIFADGQNATLAAARATASVPIVFVGTISVIDMGLVQSYARPGRNITGAALTEPGWWTGKAMQSLKQLAPRATRLAYLYPWPGPRTLERLSGSPIDVDKRIVDRARSAGFDARVFASSRTDAGPVFAEIKRWGVHAVFSPMVNVPYARQVAELALRFKLPSGFLMREAVEAGGLVSYGMRDIADERIAAELAASYIDRILRGANPATLPVELAMRYELVINAKTADALGLLIPAALRVSAEIVG